jgi:hypothetical protein
MERDEVTFGAFVWSEESEDCGVAVLLWSWATPR